MAYARSDAAAVAYVERLLDRAAEMGVTRDQIRRPYGKDTNGANRTTDPTFARLVGWAIGLACKQSGVSPCVASRAVGANQDFFRVAIVRAETRGDAIAPVLADLMDGVEMPAPGAVARGHTIEHEMREFRATPADAAAYLKRLQRAAIIVKEEIHDFTDESGKPGCSPLPSAAGRRGVLPYRQRYGRHDRG